MRIRTALAGIAAGTITALGVPGAAHATDTPSVDVNSAAVTVVSVVFVDNCDATVDVLLGNITKTPGKAKIVNTGEVVVVPAGPTLVARTRIGVDDKNKVKVKVVTGADLPGKVKAEVADEAELQEFDKPGGKTRGGRIKDTLVHTWVKPGNCVDKPAGGEDDGDSDDTGKDSDDTTDAPAPEVKPVAADTVHYANCDDVRAHDKAPIYPGAPGYEDRFDRDGDGVGCETNGQDDAAKPGPALANTADTLPVTGFNAWQVGGMGFGLILLGLAAYIVGRKRRTT